MPIRTHVSSRIIQLLALSVSPINHIPSVSDVIWLNLHKGLPAKALLSFPFPHPHQHRKSEKKHTSQAVGRRRNRNRKPLKPLATPALPPASSIGRGQSISLRIIKSRPPEISYAYGGGFVECVCVCGTEASRKPQARKAQVVSMSGRINLSVAGQQYVR